MLFLCRFDFRVCLRLSIQPGFLRVLFFPSLLFIFFPLTARCQNTGFRYLNVVSHFECSLSFFSGIEKNTSFSSTNDDPNGNCYRWWTTKKNRHRMYVHATQNQFGKCGTEIGFRYVTTRHRSLSQFLHISRLTRDLSLDLIRTNVSFLPDLMKSFQIKNILSY